MDEVVVEGERDKWGVTPQPLSGGYVYDTATQGFLGSKSVMDIPNQQISLTQKTIKDFASRFMVGDVEVQHIDEYLKDNEKITFGNHEIKVIHTPGHTKGGACFLVGDKIFTGDTLFKESVGRTDLPGGNFDEIKSSIENKLFTLDENLKVYPGHGPSSTIGYEKKNNGVL